MTPSILRGWGWAQMSLQRRLLLILWGTMLLAMSGQLVVTLSGEVAGLDQHITNHGIILAQAVAPMCADVMEGSDASRFEEVLAHVKQRVDVVELAITSRDGTVLADNRPERVGQRWDSRQGAFSGGNNPEGLVSLSRGFTEHRASVPITRGRQVLGTVYLRFRSTELQERAVRMVATSVAVGVFWMMLGAVLGSIYVRKITRPLAALTQGATALREERLDDVPLVVEADRGDEVGVLQATFAQLVTSLREERGKNALLVLELQRFNAGLRERVAEMTASLRDANAYLESVLRCIQEGIITCDPQGRIVQANRGAYLQLQGLGVPRPGSFLADLMEDVAPLSEAAAAVPAKGAQKVELVRHPGGNKDPSGRTELATGGPRTIMFRLYPLQGPDDAAMGVVVVVADETKQRVAEGQLRRHDRLISLGTIAAGLAHEMGNYIHTIHGYSSLALRTLPADAAVRPDVQAIHDDAGRAKELLERFLQFARPQGVRYHPESLNMLLREAVTMAGYKLRRAGVEVVDQLTEEDVTARCDGQLMKQVLVNIILNAVDAMAERPVRKLTLRSALVEGKRVRVQVSDTGEGIDPVHLDHIFDPFFTTKAATGTGLGLSIAHQIVVLRHEGTIAVDSLKGEGATFTVTLPVAGPEGKES